MIPLLIYAPISRYFSVFLSSLLLPHRYLCIILVAFNLVAYLVLVINSPKFLSLQGLLKGAAVSVSGSGAGAVAGHQVHVVGRGSEEEAKKKMAVGGAQVVDVVAGTDDVISAVTGMEMVGEAGAGDAGLKAEEVV
jgi:hypothetical protein